MLYDLDGKQVTHLLVDTDCLGAIENFTEWQQKLLIPAPALLEVHEFLGIDVDGLPKLNPRWSLLHRFFAHSDAGVVVDELIFPAAMDFIMASKFLSVLELIKNSASYVPQTWTNSQTMAVKELVRRLYSPKSAPSLLRFDVLFYMMARRLRNSGPNNVGYLSRNKHDNNIALAIEKWYWDGVIVPGKAVNPQSQCVPIFNLDELARSQSEDVTFNMPPDLIRRFGDPSAVTFVGSDAIDD